MRVACAWASAWAWAWARVWAWAWVLAWVGGWVHVRVYMVSFSWLVVRCAIVLCVCVPFLQFPTRLWIHGAGYLVWPVPSFR